ncbi:proline--tRNA ligase [Ferroplasma sp.]|uniref:proline--tRNA ligase n=1 Tax=Ferroplasma sp. TaxID=2591003 RepID=UPI00262CB3DB|nr:proline--tRNA ligase [Ferroplasma sp.]MCL4453862.1 proline--tRNA ligase [Candidatus Thermoplasmatota archaeon]
MENKKTDFSEWYNEIIDIAKLSDKRYLIKGMNVWLPYGLKIMHSIDSLLRDYSEESGIEEVSFPVLISREQLEVEFEHVKGFENEIYWVTKGGTNPLDIDLALRPTSEAAMYTMFPLWIRSHTDLPFRIYQIVSVYRYETKHTRSFIRVREIHFYEAHTAHKDFEDAERQMEEYIKIMNRLADDLCINFSMDVRPDWDKFPGAMYSVAFDTPMPGSRSLQIGTIHEYGENFAKNYGIKYLDDEGNMNFVSQTTFGLSERLLAAVIGIHGDDKGLVLPYKLAPVQVIIVPIPGDDYEKIISYSGTILQKLKSQSIKCQIDEREYTPGYKYNDWEMKGVPLRIEIGKREVEDNTLTLSMRTRRKKIKISLDELNNIHSYLQAVNEDIKKHSSEFYDSNRVFIDNINEIKEDRMVTAYWCGRKECSDRIEALSEKTALGAVRGMDKSGPCIVCGRPGKISAFSRTY